MEPARPVLKASVVSWEPQERLRDLASTLTVPPLPALVVSAVTLALSVMLILEPKRVMLPPLPTPLVWAVMRVVEILLFVSPLIERDWLAVPIVILPPLPRSPTALLFVSALMMELSPEKEMERSRGVEVLRLISPAKLELSLVASVVSWEPSESFSAPASTLTVPPLPAAFVCAVTFALSLILILDPNKEILPPLPTPLVWAVMRVVGIWSVVSPLMVSFCFEIPILIFPPLPCSPLPVLTVWALILE